MRLTINVPWLTYSRRLAVMVTLALLLVSVALPASAAPPDGIEGNVVVVNDAENPVPVTGEVSAEVTGSVDVSGAVTVDNTATDPVPVTGSVNATVSGDVGVSGTVSATQSGDWTVGLDATSQGHLADIDAATTPLTYDTAGNLNVHIAAGSVPSPGVQTAMGFTVGHNLIPPGGTATGFLGIPGRTVTAFSFYASESIDVTFINERPDPGVSIVPFRFRLDAGQTFAQTFPFPFVATGYTVRNLSDSDNVELWESVSGF